MVSLKAKGLVAAPSASRWLGVSRSGCYAVQGYVESQDLGGEVHMKLFRSSRSQENAEIRFARLAPQAPVGHVARISVVISKRPDPKKALVLQAARGADFELSAGESFASPRFVAPLGSPLCRE
jgi:hypothetical protein